MPRSIFFLFYFIIIIIFFGGGGGGGGGGGASFLHPPHPPQLDRAVENTMFANLSMPVSNIIYSNQCLAFYTTRDGRRS